MRVSMTGASGFVGLNIVEALLAAGHEVTCYARPGARQRFLERMSVRIVTGTFADRVPLLDAMRGAEAVIHTAGNTSANWGDIVALREANIDSTAAVLESARACGVRRIVYTSTTSTIGCSGLRDVAADESVPLTGWRSRSPYSQTKMAAEALLTQSRSGPDCILLNPAEVVGPYDHSLQWGRIVLAVKMGQLPFIPPGSGTFCPARAVAQAHLAALQGGQHGERYILGGHNVSFAEFIGLIGEVVGVPAVPHDVRPYSVQRRDARRREKSNLPVAVDSYRMRVFGGHCLFDDAKARAQLGYAPGTLAAAIEDCYLWYQENGFLMPVA